MVDCFNELLTQSNSAPTYRNRYFAPFIAAAPAISTWSRWRDTSTLAETARNAHANSCCHRGGQPMRLQDTRIHAIYVVTKCSVVTKFALRDRIPQEHHETHPRLQPLCDLSHRPARRWHVQINPATNSCVITLPLPTKPANARASLEIRG
jgi:hypothetical protein